MRSCNARRTPERRVNERIVRTEPITKTASNQVAGGGRRGALQYVVLAVEEIDRVIRIRHHRPESLEAGETRRRPLPSVADEIVYAPCARARRVRANRDGIPVREVEVAAGRIGRFVAPRIKPLFARWSSERRAVILRLARHLLAAPLGER